MDTTLDVRLILLVTWLPVCSRVWPDGVQASIVYPPNVPSILIKYLIVCLSVRNIILLMCDNYQSFSSNILHKGKITIALLIQYLNKNYFIFLLVLGVFTEYNHWWVVPVFACHIGAVAGAWLYYLAVEINWPEEEEKYDSVGTGSQNTADYRNYDYGYCKGFV